MNELRHLTSTLLALLREEMIGEVETDVEANLPSVPKPIPKVAAPAMPTLQKPTTPLLPTPSKPSPSLVAPAPAPLEANHAKEVPLEDIRRLLQQTAPKLSLHTAPPADDLAKEHRASWKNKTAQVVILLFEESAAVQQMLTKLKEALTHRGAPALLVSLKTAEQWRELLRQSPQLKLLLAEPTRLKQLPFALDEVPLCPLEPLERYLEQPALKISLWKTLCQTLFGTSQ